MTLREFLVYRLNRGPITVPMAACDAFNAGQIKRLPEDYGIIRTELGAMVAAKQADYWPDLDCWTIPGSAKVEVSKETREALKGA